MTRALMFRIVTALCMAGILLSAGFLTAIPVQASTPPQWSEPEMLGEVAESAWFPEIDVDPAGTARIIWETNWQQYSGHRMDTNAADLVVSAFGPEGWSVPATVYVKDAYNAGRPILASDDSYIHLIGRALRGGGITDRSIHNLAGIYYMRAPILSDTANVHSWSNPVPLTSNSAYWADIETLPDGGVVVIYNESASVWTGEEAEVRTTLFSRRSDDYGATWDPPQRISFTGEWAVRSSLAVAPDGKTLIAAWDEGYDNMSGQSGKIGIFTAVSTDGGKTWEHKMRVGDANAQDRLSSYSGRGQVEQSVVATDGKTTILVYRSTTDQSLLYRLSSDLGRTWSAEMPVPFAVAEPYAGPHNFNRMALAFDGDGRVLFSFIGEATGTPSGRAVMFTSYLDGEWSRPLRVAVHDGVPEYPRLAVSLGNQVFLTYFLRTKNQDGAERMSVWVVRGTSDAAASEPAELLAVEVPANSQGERPEPAPLELVPFPERPPAPQPVESDGVRPPGPKESLFEPIYNAGIITLLLLCACAVVVAFWRVTHSLRV